tara:strand:- start:631 stop:1056 length:426 start_codon:yes stop_codon:yes gene_type:complete
MNLEESINLLEGRKAKGKEGDTTEKGKGKRGHTKSQKGRVKTFDTIKKALGALSPGAMFSTDGADRTYVVSKRTHGGTDAASTVGGKIAKGFTPGSSTPGSSFSSIKKHAARTLIRYGKASKGLVKKYGSRSQLKDRGVKK